MKFAIIMVLVTFIITSSAVPRSDASESEDLGFAEKAIFTSLMIHRNPKSRHLCSQNEYACLGPEPAELGLALIASKDDAASYKSLVGLLRYTFDGELSESYSCYVFSKGRSLLKVMHSVKPNLLFRQCNSEVENMKKTNKNKFAEFNPNDLCSSQTMIDIKMKELIKGIDRKVKCD